MLATALALVVVCLEISTALSPGVGVVTVFYYSSWDPAYIHYDDGSGWTVVPGVTMEPSTNETYPQPFWWEKNLPANKLTFVFNNGAGTWDNNGGNNYIVSSPGIYTVLNGVLTTVSVYPAGCASNCNNHGTCSSSYTCTCDSGWYGEYCSCGGSSPCNGHGSCATDGSCVCTSPWGTCSDSDMCDTDLSSDTSNCGACGKECVVKQGIANATCQDYVCTLACESGYLLCDDGEDCQYGDSCSLPPLDGCEIFTDNQCAGDETETDTSYANHMWFTPHPGDADYRSSFQDYWRMTAYPRVTYNAARTQATVQIITNHVDSTVTYTYSFDGVMQSSNTKVYSTPNDQGPVAVIVYASDGAKLHVQDVDFVWDAPTVSRTDGDFRGGQKGAIVEMFGWPDAEIQAECEAIAKMGWAGIKVYPHQEQIMSLQPYDNVMNPWYFMYQPVSYRFEGRMGTTEDLRNMIYTCRKYGLRVYADAVINHMVGSGNDANPNHRSNDNGCNYFPNKNSSAADVSPFYSQGYSYTYNTHTDQNPLQEFPAVPYGPLDFHCERPLNSWTDPLELNAGWLDGLVDLNTEHEYVQQRIADFLTSLLSIGFSGFRVDAAKHISPDDLVGIFSKLKVNMGGSLPSDFVTWLEIILGGEANMLMCNEYSGYNYGKYFEDALYAAGFTSTEVFQIKIWNSGYPKEPEVDCNVISRTRNAVQNDDADQQNPDSTSRDMGDYGTILILAKDIPKHRGFEEQLFSAPRGANDNDNDYPIRLLLSSYYWYNNNGYGIPDGQSLCTSCRYTCSGCQDTPAYTAHSDSSCGYDTPDYTRTHRDKSVILAMRKWMHMSTDLSNTDMGLPSNCVAY
ncbi:alpha amylase domain protein [Pelomyxa schiedti]|nr:alpha amylase domain protein [Pelomyxa schiedti]